MTSFLASNWTCLVKHILLLLATVLVSSSYSLNHSPVRPKSVWREDGDYFDRLPSLPGSKLTPYRKRATVSHHRSMTPDDQLNMIPSSPQEEVQFPLLKNELPFDQEQTIFLLKSETKRLYFQLYKTKNVSLTVTACDSSLRWEIFHINLKQLKKLRKRKIRRRSRKVYMKLLMRKYWNHPKRELILNRTTSKRSTFSDTSLHPGLYIVQLSSQDTNDLSAKLLLSSSSDPYPQIPPVATILTKQVSSFKYFKQLSENNTGENDVSVEIWWNPALVPANSVPKTDHSIFEYCLLISKHRHHQDNCLLYKEVIQEGQRTDHVDFSTIEDFKLNDPTYPKSTDNQQSLETQWWQHAAKRLYRDSLQKELNENVVHFQCYNQTKVIIDRLQPKQTYFVDVYVKNKLTNTSSRYWPSNFTLTEPDKPHTKPKDFMSSLGTILHDSLYTGVFLDAKNKYRKRFVYILENSSTKKVNIFIQPCTGLGPVQFMIKQIFPNEFPDTRRKRHDDSIGLSRDMIFSGSHDEESNDQGILFFEEITETRTIEITLPADNSNHTRYLEFELNTVEYKQSRSLVLLASNSLHKFPFPRLPNDRTIRAMETIRDCDSVTLVWNASPDERVIYCILQRDADLKYSGFDESKDLCAKMIPVNLNKRALTDPEEIDDRFGMPTRKVICRRYKSSKRRFNNLIMQEVKKLSPGKRYVFQVAISKGKGRTLNYEQVWTETKDLGQCESKEDRRRRKKSQDIW